MTVFTNISIPESFDKVRYAELYVSIKVPVIDGETAHDFAEHVKKELDQYVAYIGERYEVIDYDDICRDEDDNIV